jgi:hypothetical protein
MASSSVMSNFASLAVFLISSKVIFIVRPKNFEAFEDFLYFIIFFRYSHNYICLESLIASVFCLIGQ